MKGYVYLIMDTEKDSTYKIGVTKNLVEQRKKNLQTGNSSELQIIDFYKTDYPYKIESMMHRMFDKSNVKNEWFKLTEDEITSFYQKCKRCEDIIHSLKDNPFYNA